MSLDQQLIRMYYKSFFPTDLMFKWLKIDVNREISFGLPSGGYLRFLTFGDVCEFKERLLSVIPSRIDVGAIYKEKPTKHSEFRVVGKELVFDIDLTDYPRTCCVEKSVCNTCLVLIKVAVKILNYSLREEFGFNKIGFVFSGRRGVHCWVSDDVAMELSDIERGEIVRYYNSVIDKKIYPEEYSKIMREYGSDGCVDESGFERMYLRIDKEVTQRSKHLIKMPFSVHPDTEVISVPIDPWSVDLIKIEDFPRLRDVIESPSILDPYIRIVSEWM